MLKCYQLNLDAFSHSRTYCIVMCRTFYFQYIIALITMLCLDVYVYFLSSVVPILFCADLVNDELKKRRKWAI